mmetsp:Transcript_19634/g.41179  ORF Transcript_19634/g.41179 Transcript_19634/m.41179 type:complete len:391 (-) Transcript_19634:210-1382(-)|eukprot:CAMPEP_0171339014 /NCGR_PEP_ID=MMETSP0878-20121228/7686_1 /TAXON_ID=67004 /ORGANISM="Thalassiosira weissflogii, Strain CCMP1336" /LENGTH=390 /DNA_ID=CAMNT_0011840867 /DNA_START=265 /DNA_END=1437 /DNA_ORIENTATION=+
MACNEDSSASGHDEPWIQWFCGLKGHEMFCEVERAYIEDGFNLYGLRACVSNFSDCLDLILDRIGPDDSDDSHLTQSACTLYGLIHARYIVTAHGLDSMYNKYAAKEFGTCPLVHCSGQPVLPVGLKDEIGVDTVKIFCPKCKCVYQPPPIRTRGGHHSSNSGGGGAVDGAAFGTTFPHLFLMTFNNLVPDPLPPESAYIPRVFGFRVHQSLRQQSIAGSGSAAAYSATVLSHNGRRGGASGGFASQRVANVTSIAAGAAGEENALLAGTPAQGREAAGEGKADKSTSTAAAAEATAQQDGEKVMVTNSSTPKSPGKKAETANDEVAADDDDGEKEKAAANDAGDGNSNSSKKRAKSDGGKNSGSSIENGTPKNRSSKRQKRPYNGDEVT